MCKLAAGCAMTGPRRLPRSFSSAKAENQNVEDASVPVLSTQAHLPRHCSLPDIPALNEIVFQLFFLGYGILILCFQNLNLYTTIWWLPLSDHIYAVDFLAIDPDLFTLICLLLSHRLLKLSVEKVFGKHVAEHRASAVLSHAISIVYYLPVLGTLYVITTKYPWSHSLLFLLPLVLYALLFGQYVKPFLQKHIKWWPASYQSDYDILIPPPTERSSSMDPEVIRREVHLLRTDFNYRLKMVYYEALVSVYYSAILPVVFCKSIHHLDLIWLVSYIMLAGLTAAILCFVHRVPATYMDTLHRSAMHLGHWKLVETRITNIPHSIWSELTVWPRGIHVKHVKGLFKAEGINNTAEPGNPMHKKFYGFFRSPKHLCALMACVSFMLTLLQFVLMTYFRHWNQVLAIAALMLSNYFALFRTIRDYLILNRVYKDEKCE